MAADSPAGRGHDALLSSLNSTPTHPSPSQDVFLLRNLSTRSSETSTGPHPILPHLLLGRRQVRFGASSSRARIRPKAPGSFSQDEREEDQTRRLNLGRRSCWERWRSRREKVSARQLDGGRERWEGRSSKLTDSFLLPSLDVLCVSFNSTFNETMLALLTASESTASSHINLAEKLTLQVSDALKEKERRKESIRARVSSLFLRTFASPSSLRD